ncbi:MAG: ATP phosphoribosyltransferase regulatory subunit [Clostridia bacterium]|nr:ATP phosphoribosyltransferase regulatory subunit [Clostridia bacterium]
MLNESLLSPAERVTFLLRDLYTKSGYQRFKMNKFEEYELYMRNKDFLPGQGAITFNEGGRLMALRPDVTLSIIKNSKPTDALCRICYNENVYRIEAGELSEIMQSGLECIGPIDRQAEYEVLRLAAESLSRIDGHYVLALSHMGYLEALFTHFGVENDLRQRLLGYLGSKNLHDMERYLGDRTELYRSLRALLTLPTKPEAAAEAMAALAINEEMREAASEMEELCRRLTADGYGGRISVDFSVVSSMKYYSGIAFSGYVNGIPEQILSGGRYDKLMRRMGKEAGAIGFALYLNALDFISERK